MNIQTIHIKVPYEPSFTASLQEAKTFMSDKSDQLASIYIWHEGLSDWMPASESGDLLGIRTKVPPPLPDLLRSSELSPAIGVPYSRIPINNSKSSLSKGQLLMIGAISVLFFGMFIFPPYVAFQISRPQRTQDFGYAFLLNPPSVVAEQSSNWSVRIDAGRLALQVFAAIAVGIVGFVSVSVISNKRTINNSLMPDSNFDKPQLKEYLHPSNSQWTPNAFADSEQKGWREFLCAAHPLAWRRFWAKCIDVGLARVSLELIAAVGQSATGTTIPYEQHPLTAGFITFIVLGGVTVLLDGLSTSMFGTTLGKKILDLIVAKDDGTSIDSSLAYRRAHLCMLHGLWYLLVFPIGPIAASYRAYKDLVKSGSTAWDRELKLHVKGKILNPMRLFAGALFGIILIIGTAYIHDCGKKELKKSIDKSFGIKSRK